MNPNSSVLSTREAAELLKCSARKIQKLISTGKLSAHRDDSGSYKIDKSEFYRVFPELFPRDDERTDAKNNESNERIKLMEEQIKSLKEINELLKSQLENSNNEKGKLIDTLNSNQRFLEHHIEKKRKKKWGIF